MDDGSSTARSSSAGSAHSWCIFRATRKDTEGRPGAIVGGPSGRAGKITVDLLSEDRTSCRRVCKYASDRHGDELAVHEFAHLIDFADDGVAQSIPVAQGTSYFDEWKQVVDVEHERLMKAYESGKNYSIRAYGGYECIKGNKPELFSCGTSAFFERGARLKRESPEIYNLFQKFYGIDPASWRRK